MISKKVYVKQLLQLALALSLMRVDPDSYLGWGLESQLALRDTGGWQLELRAAPLTEYPYANRKAMMPLIEDLVRFNRIPEPDTNNVTAYLLNVQSEINQTNPTVASTQQSDHDTTNSLHDSRTNSTNGGFLSPMVPSEYDAFFNPDLLMDSQSVLEQNLADLSDYGENPFANFPYAGLPMKDEPQDLNVDPFNLATVEDVAASTSRLTGALLTSPDSPQTNYSLLINLNDLYEPDNNVAEVNETKIKEEPDVEKEEVVVVDGIQEDDVKQESTNDDERNSTSGISVSTVELTEEESEIVEGLWKQDVDLGYTLQPPKIAPVAEPKLTAESDDDIEKLKALQELKNENKDDSPKEIDEWAGISFTIDNETGEYIQLPLQLDDILPEVFEFPDLTDETSQDKDIKEPVKKFDEEQSEDDKLRERLEEIIDDFFEDTNQRGETASALKIDQEFDLTNDLSLINLEDNATDLTVELEKMIQSAGPFQTARPGQSYGHATANGYRQPASYHHQSRVGRSVSMEQRLQDLASFFNPIPSMGVGMGVGDMSYNPHHYPYHYQGTNPMAHQHSQFTHPHPQLHHNATLSDLGAAVQPHYGPNLGTAVSSSMHLTNSSHDSDAGASGYKLDHDMMYYSNTSSELNHTDGLINSIFNDEDLQLMDMGVNDGYYTMRMLEQNSTSNNSSVLSGVSGGNHLNGGLTVNSMQATNVGAIGNLGGTHTGAGDRLDASSDSAVSSMGSERVPSLSDGEWGDTGSDSAQDYHQSKYNRPYNYSYNTRLGDTMGSRQPAVAQKKHQMFGKRMQHEQNVPSTMSQPAGGVLPPTEPIQIGKYEYNSYGMPPPVTQHNLLDDNTPTGVNGCPPIKNGVIGGGCPGAGQQLITPEMKYSTTLDFTRQRNIHELINHNHTYTMPANNNGATPRPQIRDKKARNKAEDEHLTRDEKRARAANIPMQVHDIINLPMDEFNERLSKYDLSENQLSLIRDIRRRGKNKVAAQNCRKRKLDQILSLADEVKEVRRRKERLLSERDSIHNEKKRIMNKFSALHRHIFQNLRDPDGNPYSSAQYTLQQSADGSVFLLPRDNKTDSSGGGNNSNNPHQNNSNKQGHGHHSHHHHHQSHRKE